MATEWAIKEQLRRLEGAYTPPKAEGPMVVKTWVDVLDDVPDEDLRRAVSSYLKSDRSFHPKPGQIRVIAKKELVKAGEEADEGTLMANPDGSCAVCGAPIELLTAWGTPIPGDWSTPPMPAGLTALQMLAWAEENVDSRLIRSRARYGHRHDFEAHERAGIATPDCRRTVITHTRNEEER